MARRAVAYIVGTGYTPLNPKPPVSPTTLSLQALEAALQDAQMGVGELEGLLALTPLAGRLTFLHAHRIATACGLLPKRNVTVRTVDTCGAGGVSGLLEARRMILFEGKHAVALVAGDAVASQPTREFLERANASVTVREDGEAVPLGSENARGAAAIPAGYDRVARWHMERYGTSRRQLAMAASLMSLQASRHPHALTRRILKVEDVLASPAVASVTSQFECARRADGGAALILCSSEFLHRHPNLVPTAVPILGGGEASGPLYPPSQITDETFTSCEDAARLAMSEAGVTPAEVDVWGLYDCFPICLIRAIESVGLAPKGGGGAFLQSWYQKLIDPGAASVAAQNTFPVNTHGGLLGFGAPWEVPAFYNVIEMVAQLRGNAGGRQVAGARTALVYGNGGVFSASAVSVLGGPSPFHRL